MMKNSALLMVTFAMLAFCPLGRAQDQEPTIDSTHRSSEGQYAGRQDYPHHSRNEFQRTKKARRSGRSISNTSTNDPGWMIVALPS